MKSPLRWTAWLPAFVSPRSAARETRRDAIEDEPPHERGSFREPDLVELDKLDAAVKLDIRYATSNNFVGRAVYPEARAFLQRPAAEALRRANATLRRQGYGIVVFDGYRPW
ncbi:MAG TPA: M15 family metallopeptidase, partial [Burkholderiales bacterium]|nr:M15 family metallopeptidase [Burkholderiales bacterium]